MLFSALLVSILAAGAPAAKPVKATPQKESAAKAAPQKRSSAQIDERPDGNTSMILSPKANAFNEVDAYIEPGVGVTVILPEGWVGTPYCSDCVFAGQKANGQLFLVQWEVENHLLFLNLTQEPGEREEDGFLVGRKAEDYKASMFIRLSSSVDLTINLRTPNPKNPHVATKNIRVSFPKGYSPDENEARCTTSQKAKFEGRIKKGVEEATGDAYAWGIECREVTILARQRYMVVHIKQICRDGKYIFANFTVENQSRSVLTLLDAELEDQATGDKGEMYRFYKERRILRKDEKVKATAGLSIAADPAVAGSKYSLTVSEDGGSGRTVTIRDLNF